VEKYHNFDDEIYTTYIRVAVFEFWKVTTSSFEEYIIIENIKEGKRWYAYIH